MTDLPDWYFAIHGFDPARWWHPIVCTHGDISQPGSERRPPALLSICFDHVDGELHFAGTVHVTLGRYEVDENAAAYPGQVASRGSVSLKCFEATCERNARKSRSDWNEILQATRRDSPGWIDLALLV